MLPLLEHLKSTFEVSCEAAKAEAPSLARSLTRYYPRKYVPRQRQHRELRAIAGSQRALVSPFSPQETFRRNVPNKEMGDRMSAAAAAGEELLRVCSSG